MSSAATAKPTADFTRSAVPRYIQLATLFRRRIESGQWKLGQQIPTVDDLAAEWGVARATIRQALGALEADGLITRSRAKGTFVKKQPQDELWCEVETNWDGLLTPRKGAVIELLSNEIVKAPPILPHTIGTLAPAYRHLRRRHWRNNSPFLLADVYVDERLCKKLTEADFTAKTALRMASSVPGVKVTDARQTLTIGTADLETADYLNVPLNAPVAQVDRSAIDQRDRLILVALGTYRGDVVRIDMKLK